MRRSASGAGSPECPLFLRPASAGGQGNQIAVGDGDATLPVVVYVPDKGIPHVVPTSAGMVGAHTGMNVCGIALAEMGDASANEMPYRVA